MATLSGIQTDGVDDVDARCDDGIGVADLLLPELDDSSASCWFASLAHTRLALGVPFFLGEANRFPRATCGSCLASPPGKCLLQILE